MTTNTFDPQAYLKSKQTPPQESGGFDPQAYLMSKSTPTEASVEKPKVNMDDFPRYKEESGHSFYPTSGASTAMLSGLAGLQGVLKPIAGALQWANINSPMQALEKNANYAKSSVPTTLGVNPASAMETVGEIAPSLAIPETLGTKIPQVANAIAKSPSLKYVAPSFIQGLGGQVADTENKNYLDILGEKIEDLGLSTGLGVMGGKASQMLTNPQVSARLQQLKDMGMTKFTPGQLASQFPIIGEGIQNFEKKLTSLPIAGSVIGSGLQKSYEDFNRAIANKIYEPLGIKIPSNIPAGKETMKHISDTVNTMYNDVIQNANLMNTPTVNKNLYESIAKHTEKLPNIKQRELVVKDLVDNYLKDIENKHILDGTEFRNIESDLSRASHKAYEEGKNAVGEAYSNFLNTLREQLEHQNPAIADTLQKAHAVFKNMQPIQKAVAKGHEGIFTPSQFKSAVEGSAGKTNVSKGMGQYVPEAEAATSVLGTPVPNSGTADRLAAMLSLKGLAEGAGHLKTGFAPLIGSALMYNEPMMKMMTKLATERPDVMKVLEPTFSKQMARLSANVGSNPKEQP